MNKIAIRMKANHHLKVQCLGLKTTRSLTK